MQAGSDEDVRKWLVALSAEAGLTVSDLARRAGLQPSTLTRFLKGSVEGAMLSGRTLQKLNIIEDRIRREKTSDAAAKTSGSAGLREERSAFEGPDVARIRLFQIELASSEMSGPEGSGDLEIVQSTMVRPKGEPWPIAADADDRRFAIYMPGEFMRPRFRTGECLIIDRLRPAAIGSDVLVEFTSEPGRETIGTIAELVDRDRNQVRLAQHQNSVATTIHRSHIRNIFPVIGTFRGDALDLGLSLHFD